MVTRKDYKAIAEIIAKRMGLNHKTKLSPIKLFVLAEISDLGEALADYFATQNPKFDRKRFMETCGL